MILGHLMFRTNYIPNVIISFMYVILVSFKNKSIVWNYFIRCENGGKCKICQVNVKSSGNTTNLKNHLKRKHKEDISIMDNVQDNTKKRKTQHEHVMLNYNQVLYLNKLYLYYLCLY